MIFTREDILKILNALLQLGRKDSEFKDANTPLNSGDYIAILQDGINKKVSINNLLSTLGLLKKDDFINVSDRYDEYYILLSEAITIIANNKRKKGLVITFLDLQGDWKIFQFDGELNNFSNTDYWKDLFDFKYPIVNSVLPDEEDLTLTLPNEDNNSFIKLKDKEYDTTNFSGMGTKIIRKNIIEITLEGGSTKRINYLSPDVFDSENTIYVIRYDFILNKNITIPKKCILKFDGGSLSGNYNITFNNTIIDGNPKILCNIDGLVTNDRLYISWFGVSPQLPDASTILNRISLFALKNDIELVIDSDFHLTQEWLIYDPDYDKNNERHPGPKIVGNKKHTIYLDSSNATITIQSSATKKIAEHSFYYGGYFKNLNIYATVSGIDHNLYLQGWWYGVIDNVYLHGHVTDYVNRIFTTNYAIRISEVPLDNVEYNPDYTACVLTFNKVVGEYFKDTVFYNPCEYTLVASEFNKCSFELADRAILLTGSGILFNLGSLSYCRVAAKLGNGYTTRHITFNSVEFDGGTVGEYGIIAHQAMYCTIKHCRMFSHVEGYYAFASQTSNKAALGFEFINCQFGEGSTPLMYIVKGRSIDENTINFNALHNTFIDSYITNENTVEWSDGIEYFNAISFYNTHYSRSLLSKVGSVIEITADKNSVSIPVSEFKEIIYGKTNATIILKSPIEFNGEQVNIPQNCTIICQGGYLTNSHQSQTSYVALNGSKVLPSLDFLVDNNTVSPLVVADSPATGTTRFNNGIPNWYNGTAWVDATGTPVQNK